MPKKPPTPDEIERHLAYLEAFEPLTHEDVALWLGIPVNEVPAWKATFCEREIARADALAKVWRPKAESGDAKAVTLMVDIDRQIADLRHWREYWAGIAQMA